MLYLRRFIRVVRIESSYGIVFFAVDITLLSFLTVSVCLALNCIPCLFLITLTPVSQKGLDLQKVVICRKASRTVQSLN